MRILFEAHPYDKAAIPFLEEIAPAKSQDGEKITPHYVGYYYTRTNGATFILPKVFIINGQAFGRYKPEDRIDTSAVNTPFTTKDKAFLFEVAVWLYQGISRFNDHHVGNGITEKRTLSALVSHQGTGEVNLIDHILALLRFYKTLQHLFTYIRITQQSENRKIN